MPTALERLTITRIPRVERIIHEGQLRLPTAKPTEILVHMAERSIAVTRPQGLEGLILLPDDVTVNLSAAEAALLDD